MAHCFQLLTNVQIKIVVIPSSLSLDLNRDRISDQKRIMTQAEQFMSLACAGLPLFEFSLLPDHRTDFDNGTLKSLFLIGDLI